MAGKYLCQVEHPEHGMVTVPADDNAGAVMAAATAWDVPFREIAGDCRVTIQGSALRPRCKRCHSEYGQPGDPGAYCPACLDILGRQRREAERYAKTTRRDRRIREEAP